MTNIPNELQFTHPLSFDLSLYNAEGAFYPFAYQQLVGRMIESHLRRIELDAPHMLQNFGVSWILLSTSLEIKKPLRPDDRLFARTWHTRSTPPLFRRDFAFYSENEEPVLVGTTFSSLLDVAAHRLCTNRETLKHFYLPEGEALLTAQAKLPLDGDFAEVEQRFVRPSWLDGLGHVNNMRYGEFVFDALSAEERAKMGSLTRLDVWFKSELTPGMTFSMQKCVTGNTVAVRGVILPENKISFQMNLTF